MLSIKMKEKLKKIRKNQRNKIRKRNKCFCFIKETVFVNGCHKARVGGLRDRQYSIEHRAKA